jgi:crotonobetainyl-CoA:carnitine CoA-transferase CaiB-like acyl-CoA transferase
MRDAAIEFRSERYMRLDGAPPKDHWDRIAGLYRCGDGRWVRLHTNMLHHRAGTLKLLACDYDRKAVQRALDRWDAVALETAAVEAGLVITATRSFQEWDALPQGLAVAALPPFNIDRIGDAPPQPLPAGERPLSGIRVLDLTRVIAGPVCGRTLASHGADVLLVTAAHVPNFEPLVMDNGRGKLSAEIDLREPSGRETLAGLLRQADVFIQGYRPGAIARHGFSAEEAARLRPGIVCVSLCAYGHEGPWAGRRGFDSLVQNANGLNVAEGEAAGSDTPKPLAAQALDHATGFLMAFATMCALRRRAEAGGSWHVRASLEDSDSGFGRLSAVRHSAVMSETPSRWTRPSVPLGTHPPKWPG